jgi:hypothetical protein
MPTLTGLPDAAWLLAPLVAAEPGDGGAEDVDDELQAAAVSTIAAIPVTPASTLRRGLECVPPMSPP